MKKTFTIWLVMIITLAACLGCGGSSPKIEMPADPVAPPPYYDPSTERPQGG